MPENAHALLNMEFAQQFKNKLTTLKRSKRFIYRSGAAGFARELESLLQNLQSEVDDPETGIEMIARFYEADTSIFEQCDDSYGHLGDVFRYDARALFVDFASRCDNKEEIAKTILKVNRKDDYGIRDTLIHCSGEVLPEPTIRSMIITLQQRADEESEEYNKRHYLRLIESLARQIKDAVLFEKTRIASWGRLSTAAKTDIARVYLESGDVDTAYAWLNKIPEDETFQASERKKLLEEIYLKKGDMEKLTDLLLQKFRSYHSTDTLQALLKVIGHDKQDEVVADEMRLILNSNVLRLSDAEFMVDMGMVDEAEDYLLARASQLNGNLYGQLLTLADNLEIEGRLLAVSLIYRSLMTAILDRGYNKAYSHAARYLRKLDKLALDILDWQAFDSQEEFKEQVRQKHYRKSSFWARYEG